MLNLDASDRLVGIGAPAFHCPNFFLIQILFNSVFVAKLHFGNLKHNSLLLHSAEWRQSTVATDNIQDFGCHKDFLSDLFFSLNYIGLMYSSPMFIDIISSFFQAAIFSKKRK